MQKLLGFQIFYIVIGFLLRIQAQNIQEVTIPVSGNCGMCKARIEKAAYQKGVILAEWNKDTKMLTLRFRPNKIKFEQIEQAILSVGHDTNGKKAKDEDYEKLHGCCKYRE